MKEGWLWDSILKMAASPSPMSMTPAFSPGPWSTQEVWDAALVSPVPGGRRVIACLFPARGGVAVPNDPGAPRAVEGHGEGVFGNQKTAVRSQKHSVFAASSDF